MARPTLITPLNSPAWRPDEVRHPASIPFILDETRQGPDCAVAARDAIHSCRPSLKLSGPVSAAEPSATPMEFVTVSRKSSSERTS